MQLIFGILLLFYVPNLDPYPGYTPVRSDVHVDNTQYELLPGGEQICPERHANIFSSECIRKWGFSFFFSFSFLKSCNKTLHHSKDIGIFKIHVKIDAHWIFFFFFPSTEIFFSWITPLMKLGYKRPITEKDVWKLDSWDETETLNSRCFY